jgi:hypothetical protein
MMHDSDHRFRELLASEERLHDAAGGKRIEDLL